MPRRACAHRLSVSTCARGSGLWQRLRYSTIYDWGRGDMLLREKEKKDTTAPFPFCSFLFWLFPILLQCSTYQLQVVVAGSWLPEAQHVQRQASKARAGPISPQGAGQPRPPHQLQQQLFAGREQETRKGWCRQQTKPDSEYSLQRSALFCSASHVQTHAL